MRDLGGQMTSPRRKIERLENYYCNKAQICSCCVARGTVLFKPFRVFQLQSKKVGNHAVLAVVVFKEIR